ncbi:MAG: efflux RND transporter periplasmic adaptor subunit [Pseudomonadota bacterium]
MDSHDNPQGVSRPVIESPASPAAPAKKRGRSYKGIVLALAGLVALGGLSWYLTHREPAAGAVRPGGPGGGPGGPGGPGGRGGATTTVGVATAEHADIPVVLEALGTVTAAATVTVRPQVTGVLQQVLYREGQMVKAGQLLATIDPRQFEMALMQATGQRQRDEAQLDNARLTLKRYRTLLEQDSIARQDVDTQQALVKQLEGTVLTDKAAEGTARLNLGYTRVVAPVSGRVGLRVVDIGNVVSSGDASGLAVITQISPIDVEFSIPQDQVPEVQARTLGAHTDSAHTQTTEKNTGKRRSGEVNKEQENADIQKDGKDGAKLAPLVVTALDRTRVNTLGDGRFLALDNQVDTQTGTVKAKARFPNDKLNLFPSQFVNVRLLLRTIQDTVVIPVTALRHGSKGDFVYVLNAEDKTVALRPVTRGQATVDKVEVTSGLKQGEKVITEGADRLKDGSRVTLPGERAGGNGAAGGKGKRGRPEGAAASNSAATPASNAAAGTASSAAGGEHHRRRQEASSQ